MSCTGSIAFPFALPLVPSSAVMLDELGSIDAGSSVSNLRRFFLGVLAVFEMRSGSGARARILLIALIPAGRGTAIPASDVETPERATSFLFRAGEDGAVSADTVPLSRALSLLTGLPRRLNMLVPAVADSASEIGSSLIEGAAETPLRLALVGGSIVASRIVGRPVETLDSQGGTMESGPSDRALFG
jgi:hypothetical protein